MAGPPMVATSASAVVVRRDSAAERFIDSYASRHCDFS
jgi:hypothetical protein